ncbi:hypothetical protein AAHA92_10252 [Salvia divinorum]|uniref:Transposase n=1 Tax=Salvia divinorum TaxID=28513 RepID=A0ABD1HUR2_SALDI
MSQQRLTSEGSTSRTVVGRRTYNRNMHQEASNTVGCIDDSHDRVAPLPIWNMSVDIEQEQEEGDASRAKIIEKESRGPTYMKDIWGSIARNCKYCPLDVKNWHAMPKGKKIEMLEVVKLRFDVPIIAEKVLEDQWIKLLSYWKTEDAKNTSTRNKKARANKLMNQRTGKTSFAQVQDKLTKEHGRCPTRVQLFSSCFVSSNGNSSNDVSSKISAMVQCSDKLPEGSEDTIAPNDVFSQIMGKDKPVDQVGTYVSLRIGHMIAWPRSLVTPIEY